MSCKNLISGTTKTGASFVRPCGQCLQCHLSKKGQTIAGLTLEFSTNPEGSEAFFGTLTISDEQAQNHSLDLFTHSAENQKYLLDYFVQHTIRTLRKRQSRFEKKHGLPTIPLRYYVYAEFGTKSHRLHLHFALFGTRFEVLKETELSTGEFQNTHTALVGWDFGHAVVKTLNPTSINYAASHGIKNISTGAPSLRRASRLPPLGSEGIKQHAQRLFASGVTVTDDYQISLGDKTLGLTASLKKIFFSELKALGAVPLRVRTSQVQNHMDTIIQNDGKPYLAGISTDPKTALHGGAIGKNPKLKFPRSTSSIKRL